MVSEDEEIDQSQWVEWSKDDPLVKPERESKGDMVVYRIASDEIRSAQAHVQTIMNYLWERRVLDDQHAHDGQTYELWQLCFNAFLGYRNSPIYRSELGAARSALAAECLSEGDFERLIRRLSLHDKKLIEHAVYTTTNEFTRWIAIRGAHAYQRAFDRLSLIMEELRQSHDTVKTSCKDDHFS